MGLFILFMLPIPGRAALVEDVRQALAAAEWNRVDRLEHVSFGKERWQGARDLSFRFKAASRDGDLLLWCEVTDDRVLLREGDTILSDHVELWLCDPALRKEFENIRDKWVEDRQDLEAWIRKLGRKRGEIDWAAEAREHFQQGREALAAYPYAQQLRFNRDRVVPRLPLGAGACEHAYEASEGGYRFFARIRLFGAISMKQERLAGLLFRVDVIDDDGELPGQKSLLSSGGRTGKHRVDTLDDLKFRNPAVFSWPPRLRAFLEAFPQGHAALTAAGYELVMPVLTKAVYDGYPWLSWMVHGGYKPLALFEFALGDAHGMIHEKRLVLECRDAFRAVDLEPHIHGLEAFAYAVLSRLEHSDACYFLIRVEGASNSFANGRCGGGTETDWILIRIPDRTLAQVEVDSVQIESCLNLLSSEPYGTDGKEKHFRAGSRIWVELSRHGEDMPLIVCFDTEKPEAGLVKIKAKDWDEGAE